MTPRAQLTELFLTAIHAADPMRVLPAHVPPRPEGRLIVIGAGKASARMAEALEAHYGPCEGLVITRYGYARPCAGIEIVEAAHPVPDQAGVDATARMLDLVTGLGAQDTVIALISGGGSALLCAPPLGVSLDDMIAVNSALLASGAPIGEMNVIRQQLSRVQGGRLAAACAPAQVISLLISDVPGDDPALIASGPTVGAAYRDPHQIIAAHGLSFPEAALDAFEPPVPVSDPRLADSSARIIAAPGQSLAQAAGRAAQIGFDARILGDALEGEARDLARTLAAEACSLRDKMRPGDAPIVLLSGGECTVTRRGDGVGGPNAEFVLAAALALDGAEGIYVLAGDTDGVDGAAEVAGAFADPGTLARAAIMGLSAEQSLARNDAHRFFAALEDQIVTGPTLTNVNDFRALLIAPPTE